jgi:hypothetical protein
MIYPKITPGQAKRNSGRFRLKPFWQPMLPKPPTGNAAVFSEYV